MLKFKTDFEDFQMIETNAILRLLNISMGCCLGRLDIRLSLYIVLLDDTNMDWYRSLLSRY